MKTRYEITIKEINEGISVKRGQWCVVEKQPWTEQELQEATSSFLTGAYLKENPLKEVMGYAPNYECLETKETEVLRQNVEELDLAAVIRAINNL